MAEIIEKPKSFNAKAQEVAKRIFRYENAVLLMVLIALIAVMSGATHGLTTSRTNMMNVLLQSSTMGVAAIGQAFVVLSAGIDISVGGVGLMCAILGAKVMTLGWDNILGYPIPMLAGVLIMLLVGVVWGVINGSLVSRAGVPPLIVTLGMWQISTGVAFLLSGGRSVSELPRALAFFGQSYVTGVPVAVVIFIAVVVVAYFVLNHTTFGRSVYAVGGNPISAWLSGIGVKSIRFIVYIISGFTGGLAGVIMTARCMSASMRTLSGLELDAIAAVFIGGVSLSGGKGSLLGVVIGVLIIGIVNNGMSVLGAGPAMMGIVKGAIIIGAVAIDFMRRRG